MRCSDLYPGVNCLIRILGPVRCTAYNKGIEGAIEERQQ